MCVWCIVVENGSVKVGIPITFLAKQEMCDVVLRIASLQCKHLFKSFAELDPYKGLPKYYIYCEKNIET